jgi:hypothetical protein
MHRNDENLGSLLLTMCKSLYFCKIRLCYNFVASTNRSDAPAARSIAAKSPEYAKLRKGLQRIASE